MLSMCLCVTQYSIAEQFQWGDNYQPFYADLNNDGITDLLLQSDSEQVPSELVLGEVVNGNVVYLTANQQTLPSLIGQYTWSQQNAAVTIGDFNADDITDVFVTFLNISQAFIVVGQADGIDFNGEPTFSYSSDNLSWLAKSKEYDVYPGDFNGDKRTDLIAVSTNHLDHFLMHSDVNGSLSVVQEISKSAKWGKNGAERLTIGDYNGDGKDDIFAIARKKNQSHYVVIADDHGQFNKSNTQSLPTDFAGVEWNEEDFSHIIQYVDDDHSVDIIRLQNAPGGFDENGNYYPEGILPPENLEDIPPSTPESSKRTRNRLMSASLLLY